MSSDAVAWNNTRLISELGSYLLVLYIASILKISWDLFLLKNRDLGEASVPAAVPGDVLRPLVPSLRRTSDGRAPGRERLNYTLNRWRRASKCAFGQLTTRWSFLQNYL